LSPDSGLCNGRITLMSLETHPNERLPLPLLPPCGEGVARQWEIEFDPLSMESVRRCGFQNVARIGKVEAQRQLLYAMSDPSRFNSTFSRVRLAPFRNSSSEFSEFNSAILYRTV
jgi:hypothetical protein